MSLRILPLFLSFIFVPSAQAQDHKGTVARPEHSVFQDARDGLTQMGYTINTADSVAGSFEAERLIGTDASAGTVTVELDIQLTAASADTTVIEIHTVTWKQFSTETRRHRERTPAPMVEGDADRSIEALT